MTHFLVLGGCPLKEQQIEMVKSDYLPWEQAENVKILMKIDKCINESSYDLMTCDDT